MPNLKFLVPLSKIVQPARMLSVERVNALLLTVPRVKISKGKNQYLLMMIYMHGKTRFGRTIVRGDEKRGHEAIYDETKKEMDDMGLCIKALGGGFIKTIEKKRLVRIYGCCQTFGEAPHGRTKDILLALTQFQGYNILLSKK